jgi:hypothetical protein
MAMSTSKHQKFRNEGPFKSDLERNPGIGQSKGSFATGEDPEELEGDSTVEGDVENDTNAQGGVDEHRLGRTNK